MVQFFLCPGCSIPKEKQLFAGQAQVQAFLLLLAVACIPVILVVKPYLIKKDMNNRVKNDYGVLHDGADEVQEHAHDDHGHGEDFQEIAIHQLIHTIEYVLGSISNTASYLRLWALSLAHAQLAEVFFEKGFLAGMNYGVFALFLATGAFMGLTLGVLLAMETLSAVTGARACSAFIYTFMLIFAVSDTARRPFALGGMAEQIFRWQRREGDRHLLISVFFFDIVTFLFFSLNRSVLIVSAWRR
jgi:hypothetical protein